MVTKEVDFQMSRFLGLPLLVATIGIELVTSGIVRLFLVLLPLLILGVPDSVLQLAFLVFVWPLLAAVASLLGFPGSTVPRWSLGARRPTQEEAERLDGAMDLLAERGAVRPRIFVVDSPMRNAFVTGRIVYVQTSTIHDPYLRATLAHELGHANSLDGRINLALARLTFPGFQNLICWLEMKDLFVAPVLARMIAGGWADRMWPLSALWNWYWRYGEYRADAYAVELGEGTSLAELLEAYARPIDSASPFWRDRSHPFAAQRIDRLRRLQVRQNA